MHRPLTLIIIINIFEYLALSTTLYPLTSIRPYKKRLNSLQYSVFYKSYFMINLKISRIRPLFQNFRGVLISRISAVPIFRGINFRGNSRSWPKKRNLRNLIPIKYGIVVVYFILFSPRRNALLVFQTKTKKLFKKTFSQLKSQSYPIINLASAPHFRQLDVSCVQTSYLHGKHGFMQSATRHDLIAFNEK